MSITLVAPMWTFLGFAALDALNPLSIAAMAALLAMDQPVARGGAFIVGTAAVDMPFGVALLEGWRAALSHVMPTLPVWSPAILEIGFGVAFVAAAALVPRQALAASPGVRPSSSILAGVGGFAIASTMAGLPAAVPYVAAASQIPMLAAGRPEQYAWLGLYNLICVAPLLGMLGVRLTLGAKAEEALAAARQSAGGLLGKLLPWLLLLLGLALMVDGAVTLLVLYTLVWLLVWVMS